MPKRRDRGDARLTFAQPLAGDVTAKYEVSILDLSLGGAQLGHTVTLRPGHPCFLRLALGGPRILLQGRVMWSHLVGRASGMNGSLLFRTGIQFERLAEDTRSQLAAFLASEQTASIRNSEVNLPGPTWL